ncbi:DUF881 domain-containing protein [Brachybacterium sacelli]|uniref:Uncharacterized protein YlxW (UPF0749 family) n=1 Tax=Brachybacterium sacelli TaxID=173364 RepID=A0ABS4X2T3_9MICO|nr:DUF881 domain-containing protein [Brachybacterium sacelli]MBP2382767.1 uncharacterized protein YlxW (UPF0749 family) [Brachybacterium sacelli]
MPAPTRSTPHGETPYSPSSLLRALTANPYDVDALREDDPLAEAAPPDNRPMRTLTLLLALALGFVVAVAVTDLRRDAAGDDDPRALLEQEVLEARGELDELESRQEGLEGQIADAQAVVLDSTDADASERLRAYEAAGAGSARTGPGVVLTVEDSAPLPASPGVSEGTVNRVTDDDLQIAVNGLWAAGAEAIAVNGQRLSATSAIRTAGSAVLVDFRPLSPPYEITALGDPEELRAAVDAGESGDYLSGISARFGIRHSWGSAQDLTVPARPVGTLREASELEAPRESTPETSPSTAPASDPATGGARKETE